MRGQLPGTSYNDTPRLPCATNAAYGQARIVHSCSFRSDQNCVHLSAQLTRVAPGGTPCDQTRLASMARQSTVERHSAFCDNKGSLCDDPLVERLVNLRG